MTKDVVITELHKILQRDGVLTPRSVVDESRNENSPLHSLFDWDNASAGEKYRLWQARQIISNQKVTLQDREVHQYYSLRIVEGDESSQSYVSIEQVLSNEQLYRQALAIAVKDLESWRKKYEELEELKDIVNVRKLSELKQSVETVTI